MGILWSTFLSYFPKEVKIVNLGLDNAGKTTLTYQLHTHGALTNFETVPTIGFNVEKFKSGNIIYTMWDIGGQDKSRVCIWHQHLKGIDLLLFLVDIADEARFGEAIDALFMLLKDNWDRVFSKKHIPIIICLNKTDITCDKSLPLRIDAFKKRLSEHPNRKIYDHFTYISISAKVDNNFEPLYTLMRQKLGL
jgi:small GTP-binding protein